MPSPRLAAGLLALLPLACHKDAPSQRITAASYAQACEASADCFAIFEGELGCCGERTGCPNASIRVDEFARYEKDIAARSPMCGTDARCPNPGSCAPGVLTCPHGTCELHPWGLDPDGGAAAARSLAAADYPRACDSVADCIAVYQGPLGCCNLPCPNTAIRSDAKPQYDKHVAARTPNCFPAPSCPPSTAACTGRIACTNNACELVLPPPDASTD